MKRGKNIILVSHCIMNQNSVVFPLGRASGGFKFVNNLLNDGIGVIQLPCPELRYLGIERAPMKKSEYDTKAYRNLCVELFMPVMEEIITYIKNDYNILGIMGINESPTCSITGARGIFMEEVFNILHRNNLSLNYMEVPSQYDDDTDAMNLYNNIKKKFGF
jgi:predicted secreted protein